MLFLRSLVFQILFFLNMFGLISTRPSPAVQIVASVDVGNICSADQILGFQLYSET